jgi:GGDEF domain-containing protein
MPTDLLLPAFVLTLLANTILVAVAVRALLRARDVRDRATERLATPETRPPRTTEPTGPRVDPAPPDAPTEDPPAPIDEPMKPARKRRVASSGEPAATRPARPRTTVPQPPPATKPSKRKPRPKALGPGGETRQEETPPRRRRRFSLPPLDDDHERVSRSIETFLAGGESVDPGEAGRGTVAATTVAVVAIDGLEPSASVEAQAALARVVATVERILRGAARATDRVSSTGPGRFRVILPATGELAARAYLRRVRATVEPSLEAADVSLGLVTATSTVLDDTPGDAIAQADARLDSALASATGRVSRERPRAASD